VTQLSDFSSPSVILLRFYRVFPVFSSKNPRNFKEISHCHAQFSTFSSLSTMLSTRIPSVKDTYFQHKLLTKIHGKPTYPTLQTLYTELKANAGSVPTTLGGGLHGHLGLLLPPTSYATLQPATAWVTPPNPGPFVPPNPGTTAQINAARDVWNALHHQFEVCQATDKALLAQVVDAIDEIYLRALLNRATGQYSSTIRDLMTHLFTTYGQLTPQQVKAKEAEVYNLHFDISQPVDILFNAIEDLSALATHASSPMSNQQMIDMAYVIFAKQPILQQDLRAWKRFPPVDRTWANMITHFREAQNDLSSLPVASDFYHQTPAHQANHVDMIADLVAQRLLDTVTPMLDPTPPSPVAVVAAPAPPPQHVAAVAAATSPDLASIQQQLQQLVAIMAATTTAASTATPAPRPNNQPARNYGRGRGYGRGREGRGQTTAPSPRMYCWTHGACAHSSTDCNNKAPGHQPTATFTDMKGGSIHNCFWINPSSTT
jgi:hypothetical protein